MLGTTTRRKVRQGPAPWSSDALPKVRDPGFKGAPDQFDIGGEHQLVKAHSKPARRLLRLDGMRVSSLFRPT